MQLPDIAVACRVEHCLTDEPTRNLGQHHRLSRTHDRDGKGEVVAFLVNLEDQLTIENKRPRCSERVRRIELPPELVDHRPKALKWHAGAPYSRR